MMFFKPTISKFSVLILFFNIIPFILGRVIGIGAFVLIILIPSYWLDRVLIIIGFGDFLDTIAYRLISFLANSLIAYFFSCLLVYFANKFTDRINLPKKYFSIGIAIFTIVLLIGMSFFYWQFGVDPLNYILFTGVDWIVLYITAYSFIFLFK